MGPQILKSTPPNVFEIAIDLWGRAESHGCNGAPSVACRTFNQRLAKTIGMSQKWQRLDRILRDGGYYTNCDFDQKLVEGYLRSMSQ